jgi:ribosomal protein S18 acetylase RimI-like enzyme
LSSLRPISEAEYASWLAIVVPEYAEDKIKSGQWSSETALQQSRREFEDLLPQGRATPDNYFYTVLGPNELAVGALWFASKARAGRRVAFVCDIYIYPEHRRRGYAMQAFQDLELEIVRLHLSGIALHVFGHNLAAQALYEKLGYVPTNISMFKPVTPH